MSEATKGASVFAGSNSSNESLNALVLGSGTKDSPVCADLMLPKTSDTTELRTTGRGRPPAGGGSRWTRCGVAAVRASCSIWTRSSSSGLIRTASVNSAEPVGAVSGRASGVQNSSAERSARSDMLAPVY